MMNKYVEVDLFMNIAIYLFMINEKKIIILKYTLEE